MGEGTPIAFCVHRIFLNSRCGAIPESIETIFIGGGQAGLSMSYHLTRVGRQHVVLERGRVVERWLSERWDSLAFQFTNSMLRLPGNAYSGDAPHSFIAREGVARFVMNYAVKIAAPLRCGVAVTSARPTDQGRFVVQAGQQMDGSSECGRCDRTLSASVSSAMQRIVSLRDISSHGEPLHSAF
jgi:cation diffusion facilitator CzcD-associated flavoprotein CzcO